MKTTLTTIASLVILFLVKPLAAQDFQEFEHLFQLLKPHERAVFRMELRITLIETYKSGRSQLAIFKQLRNDLPVADPTAGIDSMLNAWEEGRENLEDLLSGSDVFGSAGSAAILSGFDQANAGWIAELGQLQTALDANRDSLTMDKKLLDQAENQFKNTLNEQEEALKKSSDAFFAVLDGTPNQPGNWEKSVNSFLNDFGGLEIGAGMQSAYAVYYDDKPDSATVSLIRFGSAPNYDNLWGMEWDSWISFNFIQSNHSLNENPATDQKQLNPLLAGGSFSFQYRPEVPFTGGVMRLIAGVGAKADVYMPARIYQDRPSSFKNKGKTTGLGPLVRLGFAVNAGSATFYSVADAAWGHVLRHENYPYEGRQAVAGVFWNGLHLRMATGRALWAYGGSRTSQFKEVSFNVSLN
ncbi:MAG: hypothetical protein KIPDCIKN_01765 [Haliscomenobacter sp.]|nr:hypothetical protein [Haliscomenobacter sp.]